MDGDITLWSRNDGPAPASEAVTRLSEAARGDRGVVLKVLSEGDGAGGIEQAELERRLLEIGFVEGARVEILHEGFIGRDPIAVKLDDMRVALRRREGRGVLLKLDDKDVAGAGKARAR